MKFRLHVPRRKPPEPPSLDDFITIDLIYLNFKEEIWDRCVTFAKTRSKRP